jgi:hypothetical protein
VSSTGGSGSAFGNSDSKGYSSSYAEKPSGAKAMTDSSGSGTAQTDASVNTSDQSPSSAYSNVQNSGYGASISVTGDTTIPLDTVLEDLTAETSKDVPFFGLFGGYGGFGAILVSADPDDSTSDSSVSGEDASDGVSGENASDGSTSDTETIEGGSSTTTGT